MLPLLQSRVKAAKSVAAWRFLEKNGILNVHDSREMAQVPDEGS